MAPPEPSGTIWGYAWWSEAVQRGKFAAVESTTTYPGLLDAPETATSTVPVTAPVGTVAVICVSVQTVGVAGIPMNVTSLVPCEAPNPVPVICTDAPTVVSKGLMLVMTGLEELAATRRLTVPTPVLPAPSVTVMLNR